MTAMRIAVLFLSIFFVACAQAPAPEVKVEKPPMERDAAADAFIKRMKEPGPAALMQSAIYSLTHDYSDVNKSDLVMKKAETFIGALGRYENGNPDALKEFGGVTAFKEQCAAWLKDEDQSIRAFAAVMLGLAGDKNYAPNLSELLKDRKMLPREKGRYDRGRAAIALGMVGATDRAPQLAKLLTSSEFNDRQGGALGLGFMNAKEYAPEIAKLLKDKESNVRNDAYGALKLMGMESLAEPAKK